MDQLESILVTISLFIVTAIVVIAILNFILRNRLINSGQTDPTVLKILGNSFDHKVAMLKWGIVMLFGGLGLVTINYIPDAVLESPLPYGIEMIFLAAGFLGYYLIARKSEDSNS